MGYEKTVSIAGRIDICSMATVARGYLERGVRIRSRSDLLWQAVEHVAAIMVKTEESEAFTDVREATNYLRAIGLTLETNQRALRSVGRAKLLQDAEEDYGIGALRAYERKKTLTGRQAGTERLVDSDDELPFGIDVGDMKVDRERQYQMANEDRAREGKSPWTREQFRAAMESPVRLETDEEIAEYIARKKTGQLSQIREVEEGYVAEPLPPDEEEVVRSTDDEEEFAAREKRKREELRAGLAFVPGLGSGSKQGEV